MTLKSNSDPKKPWKAYASTAASAVALFVAAWIADTDPFTAKEMGAAALGALVGSGIVGGLTYKVPNPVKPPPAPPVVK